MTVTWQESVSEMGGRWFTGLSPGAWFGVQVGMGAVALTCVLIGVRAKPVLWRVASSLFALGAAAWSIHLALETSWIADDAFISFRYARNFAEGNGLVWNVGERLEGYTNFLWTVLLGLGQVVGIAPSNAATVMTLGSLVALAVGATWKLSRPGWVPIAPALLVLSPAFVEFGTSGLEAGPTAMCIGFAALSLADEKRRHLAGWWVLTAALLRANGIPAGLCYQRLSIDDIGAPFTLHGLNAVHLADHGWYRIDPRGEKPGVTSAFTPPIERLAYAPNLPGEGDLPEIWPDPLHVVVDALMRAGTWDAMLDHLPDVELRVSG